MLTAKYCLTIAVTALAVAGPQLVVAVPPDFRDLASALFAVLGALYHLYQPAPNGK
jgi:hypothetical protein